MKSTAAWFWNFVKTPNVEDFRYISWKMLGHKTSLLEILYPNISVIGSARDIFSTKPANK